MTSAVWTSRIAPKSLADGALKGAAGLWFATFAVGQAAFLYYILAFYGASILTGHFEVWAKNPDLIKGYVAGDIAGNLFFAAHVTLAAIVTFGGVLQLVPQIRVKAPAFHRWNGRVFLTTAAAASLAGFYMIWVRGSYLNLVGAAASSLNVVLVIAFGILAWRAVLAREITEHRRWALRIFLAANGVWFTRVAVFGWMTLNHRPVGMTDNMDGPVNYVIDFGCYLLPLAMLELYLRAKAGAGSTGRIATAGTLVALTAFMGVGIFGFGMFSARMLTGH
jgi:hypothetical protein